MPATSAEQGSSTSGRRKDRSSSIRRRKSAERLKEDGASIRTEAAICSMGSDRAHDAMVTALAPTRGYEASSRVAQRALK